MDVDLRKRARAESLEAVSRTLADLLQRDAKAAALLEDEGPLPAPADYVELAEEAARRGGISELRAEKRRRLLEIAARDAAAEISLEETTRALADLADGCLQATLGLIDPPDDLAIVAMGKLGGRELNYVSDIDIMFITSGDPARATKAVGRFLQELGGHSPEGSAYFIDVNLRPEGRSGALVRSLDSYLEYYERWAKPWEYQALLKARPAAGDLSVAQKLVDETRSFVFPPDVSAERVADIRKMKERVENHAARAIRRTKGLQGADVKLGPGGIRDIEFCVQLLQLVHGAADDSLHFGGTVLALQALSNGGYVADEDAAGLYVAYRWLRTVEHRLQLWQERRIHQIPSDEEARTRFAKAMGFKDSPVAAAVALFDDRHRAVLADVRARFERIFYRPMIESLAHGGTRRLSSAALQDRLRVLGFRDVQRASRNLESLVSGTSRQAKLLRVLTPAMLRFLAPCPAPDEGLLSFLRLGEALTGRVDVLGALRDNPPGLSFLARVLGSGRLLGDVLAHVPEQVSVIANPERFPEPKDRDQLAREAVASLEWRDPDKKLDGLRRFKRREMLDISMRDLAGLADVEDVGRSLSDLADAVLEAALDDLPQRFAVIGMGKLGGRELNYASDVDVMFVHEGDVLGAEKEAERLLRSIGDVTPEGQAFRVDAGLRPEGKAGALSRSVDAYVEYYERWSRPWEHQALIKARWVAGDRELARELLDAVRPKAFPSRLSQEALREMRHLKARMEKERIGRGVDPRRHMKMGPGAIADVEFAIQLVQRRHAYRDPLLQTTSTTSALTRAAETGLIDEGDARVLKEAYAFLMRLRNRTFLLVARPVDVLSSKPEELEALGVAMGFEDQPRQELEETYLRMTRRSRRVAEGLIYG
ncbi:MAG: bifunctional [glutamine synthetase] adenylyltransferase/[glutamine synthetase]-adenylyl-L-tyrosine phosphorylase [Actinomycetota bacterium]|nr:bifunctional [glutamine synthetase] adenylyltransferase/[glutamine synthetase]-adenylyl-L-tyrosine phosphorylase [Actinomycetota bacterium]